ncbi:hypothetical protein LEP1GSC099_4853 [Leptospira interrogans str. UI 08452]|nr:hypothetical protein LEP1GSC099_4853 [Leptospira interrogans str. UI 08452]
MKIERGVLHEFFNSTNQNVIKPILFKKEFVLSCDLIHELEMEH